MAFGEESLLMKGQHRSGEPTSDRANLALKLFLVLDSQFVGNKGDYASDVRKNHY